MLDLKTFSPDVLYAFVYQNDQPGTYPYHSHEFLELSIMLQGTSRYHIEGLHQEIHAGQALLFNPGVHHQETQPPNTHSTQLHIGFRHVALPGLKPDFLPFAQSIVDLGDQKMAFFECAHRIAEENKAGSAFGHDLMLQAQIVELLCVLIRALPNNQVVADHFESVTQVHTSVEQQALVAQAEYYLQAHYQSGVTVAAVAEALHVSPSYLSRTFKALKGENPMSYLTALRLNQAKQLLDETNLPINQVSGVVGYQDPFYFSRLFKQHFGQSPSQMQSEH